ncbi:MAG: hypothetical protein KDD15_13905 [Lewinella sp.]|nr:hypothetical protein [Lewinella sp.]
MNILPSIFCVEEDHPLTKKAYLDWEHLEKRASALETAYARQESLQIAQELGPRFVLHRLPQHFWVAQICEPEDQLQFYAFGTAVSGCSDLFPISDHILFFRSYLPEQEIRENIDLSFLPF